MNQATLFESLLEELSGKLELLPDKPEETPESTLRALWLLASGKPVSVESAKAVELPELDRQQMENLRQHIRQRLDGTPLAHISGRQAFMGMELLAGPEALIPRKETELLAASAIDILLQQTGDALKVIDVCTGAGNVALAIAHAVQKARVFASDLSAEAVQLARRNTALHDLSERVSLYTGDLLDPFRHLDIEGKVDMITCNPPYISSAKVPAMASEISEHEPEMAFNGGVFGINLMRKLIAEAPDFIRGSGHLVFEVGLGQGPAMEKQISKLPAYESVQTIADADGNARVVVARVC
ncbi:peptide chain release factor N(5)-glutamine methyltransferase [Thiolapillus brandeum]|uniref:peptide chain release factor N(5)-glutamine methyltransferase n=1 Tax=Thiolapillus brandeum TaxID=1076588 RepID=A0A7U6GKP1_9GAMM|nr:peptide chain release factor N(5)-glutamine methyltransferase [Thiolapillus brandeum]BAO45422.1 methyltransferase [Thiolapillus brandeum]